MDEGAGCDTTCAVCACLVRVSFVSRSSGCMAGLSYLHRNAPLQYRAPLGVLVQARVMCVLRVCVWCAWCVCVHVW